MITLNIFNETKEITAGQFESLWAMGGERSTGASFSNMNSHTYLWCENPAAKVQSDVLQKQIDSKYTEMQEAYDKCASNASSLWTEWHNLLEQQAALPVKVTNIIQEHIAYNEPKQVALASLPKGWTEVYLEHFKYGEPTKEKVLVARKNSDGTVQLFKA